MITNSRENSLFLSQEGRATHFWEPSSADSQWGIDV